jgi:hypothetical protein
MENICTTLYFSRSGAKSLKGSAVSGLYLSYEPVEFEK